MHNFIMSPLMKKRSFYLAFSFYAMEQLYHICPPPEQLIPQLHCLIAKV